jgi:hypothetical protein
MSIQATYHGEVRVVRSSYTSKTGPTITLALHDIDELNKVQGMDGKRYMLALVEIGEDEQPIQKPEVEKLKGGALSVLAARWCADEGFRAWFGCATEKDAAERVRRLCDVTSRAHIDHTAEAGEKFQRHIRGPYMKHLAMNGGVHFSCPEEVAA